MNKLIFFLCIIAISILGYFGFLILSDVKEASNDKNDTNETNVSKSIEDIRESIGGTITEEQAASYKEQGLNPFGQSKTADQLTDADYQEYIHGMSHQKVKAEQKWGFYQITPQRIHWLLEGLDATALKHEEVYRTILEKWAKGDFTTADVDHNTIWEIQGGNIGRATGVLTPEEEEAYIRTQR
ncbi:hypothetical protein KGF86_17565 [Ornithinibacillus massiliensis]|uniref:Uncharacterized protein n=1 Tax=Ornithinibacillus massiliensis TaxID=1944633 RepID=A0ABS5MIU3_9BACI|nr:DUF6241 domain-containing protein [Ornithinibacillus massiliensis]MBS3682003.1 hypothetical protein [Ornithinibacillus massiliensis]